MNLILIEDVHVEWHGETGDIRFYVEFPDGKELEIASIVPDHEPDFADGNCEESEDYQDWYNEALNTAKQQGYVMLSYLDDGAMLCFTKKKLFVDRVSYAISGDWNISNVTGIRYEVFQSKTHPDIYQEYIIMAYRGGAAGARTVNGNSHSAILREISKLTDGGYYIEMEDYKKFIDSPDWLLIDLRG